MRGALGGPRVLLRRLREVMAEPVSAQERLNKIVVLIAANMVAEVCSVYVLRVDGTLELYASEGLNAEAVHVTVLRQDEGLVGLVASEAKSLNLSDAQHHPARGALSPRAWWIAAHLSPCSACSPASQPSPCRHAKS